MTSDPIARYQSQRAARIQRAERLRPMTSTEVLDAALRLYQRQGLTFLRLTALPSVFCLAASAFVLLYIVPAFTATSDPSSIVKQVGEVSVAVALAIFVGGPVFFMGLTYGTAVVVKLASDSIEGRESSEAQALESARLILPRLFWVHIRELVLASSGFIVAAGVLIVGAVLTLTTPDQSAIPGIVAAAGILVALAGGIVFLHVISRDALTSVAAVIEGLSGKASAKRSRQLLNRPKESNRIVQAHGNAFGSVWNLYFILFMGGLMILLVSSGLMDLLDLTERVGAMLHGAWIKPLVVNALDLLPYYLTIWLLIPVWAATLTVIYYERRIRLEGFDIECMNKQIKVDERTNRFNV